MVSRYSPFFDDAEGEVEMIDDAEGEYVPFEEYADLEHEMEGLRDKIESLKEAVSDFQWAVRNI